MNHHSFSQFVLKTSIYIITFFFCLSLTYAQVGINTVSPNALLEVQSSNQTAPASTDGILIPKIDEFPVIAPSGNQDGMMVYVSGNGTVTQGFYYWNDAGTSWEQISGNRGELELVTEGANSGWRLRGMNAANYGNIGANAIDLSNSNTTSTAHGATNSNSFAVGLNAQSSGGSSVAIGEGTVSSATRTTAIGFGSRAIGHYSTAIGFGSYASGLHAFASGISARSNGDYAMSYGRGTSSRSFLETVVGSFNTNVYGNPSSFVQTDRHFVIGNGANGSSLSDAFVILKNGTITAPSLDITEITNPKALVTKEYLDTPESSILATLSTNWSAYNAIYTTPGYYHSAGRVYLEGLLRKSVPFIAGETIFTLPVGYRPATRKLCAGTQSGNTVRVDVLASGEVRYMSGANGTSDFLSLEGISFKIQ